MKNLKNNNHLKLANKSSWTRRVQNVWYETVNKQRNINMFVNGKCMWMTIMPKWKFNLMINQMKYLTTINYTQQKDAELEKRINEILDNHQIADEFDMELNDELRDQEEINGRRVIPYWYIIYWNAKDHKEGIKLVEYFNKKVFENIKEDKNKEKWEKKTNYIKNLIIVKIIE